jgi:uncharacterized protein with PhoU and TrkA domain
VLPASFSEVSQLPGSNSIYIAASLRTGLRALGAVGLTVRYGAKAIEFDKGKTAIIVPSKDQLVATLDTLIEGVKAGELDEHLAQQAKARGVPKAKRAG